MSSIINMIDYEVIRFIWWCLIGVLLIGFVIMDGHDMGVGILSLFVAKTDNQRRIAINSVAPHWDGNQVWFITAGGAIFAAWPIIYSAAFSGFYIAMLLVLWTLFLRPVAFEYRSKITTNKWRTSWDIVLFIASFVPPVIFGVAFGNLLQGVPFYIDNELQVFYTGSFLQLLNPFALVAGILSVTMIITHGANYLMIRTEGEVHLRAKKIACISPIVVIVLFAICGYFIGKMNGFVTTDVNPHGPSNPLLKTVMITQGAWLNNYTKYPLTLLCPIIAFLGAICSMLFAKKSRSVLAFISSAFMMVGVIFTVGAAMFPFLMPSSSNPQSSLTLWDSTSSFNTLNIMFVVAIIFTPIVLFYTSIAYKIMSGKLTDAYIKENQNSLY